MAGKRQIAQIKLGLQEGIGLERCRKCGRMKQGLENTSSTFPPV